MDQKVAFSTPMRWRRKTRIAITRRSGWLNRAHPAVLGAGLFARKNATNIRYGFDSVAMAYRMLAAKCADSAVIYRDRKKGPI
jgi:hypothetical protein